MLGRVFRAAGVERFQNSPFPLIKKKKGGILHPFFSTSKFSPYSMLCKAQRSEVEI